MFEASHTVRSIIAAVDAERLGRDVFALSRDLVPCRVLNYCVPGSDKSTLHTADALLQQRLESLGYRVERDVVKVQAFVPDPSVALGFRRPRPDEPWYEAVNLDARRMGSENAHRAVVVLAHKDSQSWLHKAPGAYDNAVGIAAVLEIARIAAILRPRMTVIFLFCNEEHWPWTSITAAEKLAESNLTFEAVINIDSIGGKAPEDVAAGRHINVTRYVTPEGERIADLMSDINDAYEIGLEQRKHRGESPNDDDGSFVNAGILPAVLNIGSLPYSDSAYHTIDDRPERVDIENVLKATRLMLATLVEIAG